MKSLFISHYLLSVRLRPHSTQDVEKVFYCFNLNASINKKMSVPNYKGHSAINSSHINNLYKLNFIFLLYFQICLQLRHCTIRVRNYALFHNIIVLQRMLLLPYFLSDLFYQPKLCPLLLFRKFISFLCRCKSTLWT